MASDSYSQKTAWKNGSIIPASSAVLPVEDMGIVHGVSVTEMLRTFSGQAFKVGKHLDRLFYSAELLEIPIRFSLELLRRQLEEVVSHNQSLLPDWQEQGIIIFATPGINATYTGQIENCEPTVVIHTFDLPGELWKNSMTAGQHLAISNVPQVPNECLPVTAKFRSRLNFYLADREVQKRFPDARAILLNAAGSVRETGTSNLFLVKDNQIWTAPHETVLPGISRELTIEIAKSIGYKVVEKDFSSGELCDADEIFTTSTPYSLLGVSRINGQRISDKFPGPVTTHLLKGWDQLVGQDIHPQLLQMADHREVKSN